MAPLWRISTVLRPCSSAWLHSWASRVSGGVPASVAAGCAGAGRRPAVAGVLSGVLRIVFS